ncbi:MAG: hypothetical protein A3A16_02795 [Candidatus Harrisonbacteria bacterium RIFCSPLOWO2_01_FULL_44_18]|uniref:Glycosyl transferase family 1 domain-containing protein n=1 Tax=Candidatus Harrisonbacteria bacterium RIFCSPLOWO2_01_FULL_44_18 TaxID=1798407 RepID=A0A1G1ZLD3_9BACT|nr:MAG: hypothetical protein A3A16_02795 [Candidatus Harrisonbacteria bacterium RIFCSPLOWO2_01_FULL_44_18]
MLNSNNKPKLCYVLPDYRPKSHTHFAYLVDFVGEISNFFNTFLIIEKGERPRIDLGCQRVQVLWFQFFPLRWCELHCRLFYARLLGYKTFYVHYSFLSAFLSSLIARLVGGRTFYWNCGLPWQYKRNFLRATFELITYRLITFLVTGTEGLKKEYAQHYHLPLEKIKVMPNWINLEKVNSKQKLVNRTKLKIELKISENAKVILFAHRLSRRKGAHYLPEILNKLRDENVVTVIIGDGPEKENIQLLITNYQLQDKVRFLGWIPNSELSGYYSIADVFIMPSEEEGFPHVLLEAMAVGTPFVAFDVGGVKEMLPPELLSYVVPLRNVDAFVAKIEETLRLSGDSYAKISEIEKKWVERYDIKKVARLFSSII